MQGSLDQQNGMGWGGYEGKPAVMTSRPILACTCVLFPSKQGAALNTNGCGCDAVFSTLDAGSLLRQKISSIVHLASCTAVTASSSTTFTGCRHALRRVESQHAYVCSWLRSRQARMSSLEKLLFSWWLSASMHDFWLCIVPLMRCCPTAHQVLVCAE